MTDSNPYDFAKSANNLDTNSGPLSLATTSGIPNLENMGFSVSIIVAEVVCGNVAGRVHADKYLSFIHYTLYLKKCTAYTYIH